MVRYLMRVLMIVLVLVLSAAVLVLGFCLSVFSITSTSTVPASRD